MKIDLEQVKIRDLQMIYRTEESSKWLLELIFPMNDPVSIYITRPVNETADRLKNFLKSCRNLNHLLLTSEQ